MEKILTQAKQAAEEAEIFTVSSEEMPVQFEANRLKNIQSKQSGTVALRIIKQGKIGYAASTELDDSQSLVNNAVETAQFGMPAEFVFPSSNSYPQIEVLDPEIESVSIDKMVELGEELITAVREHTPDIVCEAEVTKGVSSVRIINSRGGEASYRKSIFSLGVGGTLIRGTDMLFVGEGQSSCHPILDAKAVTEVVLHQLELAKSQASIPSRPMHRQRR